MMKIGELKKTIESLDEDKEVYVSAIFLEDKKVCSRKVIQGEQDTYGNLHLKIVIRDEHKKVLDYPLKGPGEIFDTKT